MGIRSSNRPHLRSSTVFSGLLLGFATPTARGTILSELGGLGELQRWLIFTIGELLGCESWDVGRGRVVRKKMEIILEGEAWKRESISSYHPLDGIAANRYTHRRFLASYTYSRLRIRIVQNNY